MSTKITKTQLEKLIKEETEKILSEAVGDQTMPRNAGEESSASTDLEPISGKTTFQTKKILTDKNIVALQQSSEAAFRAKFPRPRDLFDAADKTSGANAVARNLRMGQTNALEKGCVFAHYLVTRSLSFHQLLVAKLTNLSKSDTLSAQTQTIAHLGGKLTGTPRNPFKAAVRDTLRSAYALTKNDMAEAFEKDVMTFRGVARVNAIYTEIANVLAPVYLDFTQKDSAPVPAPNKKDCATAEKLIAQIKKLDSSNIPTDIGKLPEYIASIENRMGQSFQQIAGAPGALEEGFLDYMKAKAGSAMNSVKKAFAAMDTNKLSAKQKAIVYVANTYNCPDAAGGIIKPVKPPKQSGGTCGKFNKFAVQVTGQKDVKEAVKMIQVMLVNLGYSVKRGETDSGFRPEKMLSVQLGAAAFKAAGIDGRCGRGTMGAVKRFQGANKLSADGIVGPNTYKVLTSVAKGGDNKKAAAAPAGASKADTLSIIKAYSFVYNTLRGRIVNSLQSKKTEGASGIATKLIDAVLPGLQTVGGNRYKLKNKTYSIDSPDFGSDLMAGLSALKSSSSNVEAATGIKSADIVRIVDKASDTYMKSSLEESKSYNLDFNKWSKLWK